VLHIVFHDGHISHPSSRDLPRYLLHFLQGSVYFMDEHKWVSKSVVSSECSTQITTLFSALFM
jgi:hypothetical protein